MKKPGPMLPVRVVRQLTLAAAPGKGRPPHCSSASGLVRIGRHAYVVADDELHLFRFALSGDAPGEPIRLLPGELPEGMRKRKKRKPDFEILLRLPAFPGFGRGALLALGSGSGPRRCRGVLLPTHFRPGEVARGQVIDASAFMAELDRREPDLNLEGAWLQGEWLCLLQRGNRGAGRNAVLRFRLADIIGALAGERALPALRPQHEREYSLGEVEGVPLGFSDACALPDGDWLFSAIAEDADSSFSDGPCAGAAIGRCDRRGNLRWIRPITPGWKIEGIDAQSTARGVRVLLVTDADDVRVPASLLATFLP